MAKQQLKKLTADSRLTVVSGDLQLLQGRWYITHAGLLRLAKRKRCLSIKTALVENFSDPSADRWIFKARSSPSRCFVGFDDADPSNVSSTMHGAELRIAETRAVNRALRKAYGIGICSIEELGSSPSAKPAPKAARDNHQQHHTGSNNGQPRLRDQLCLLIRDHKLDPTLVKAYAADYCGTAALSGASRELVNLLFLICRQSQKKIVMVWSVS